MSGLGNLVAGLAWLAGGVGATVFFEGMVLFWGAILAGAIQAVIGLSQLAESASNSSQSRVRTAASPNNAMIIVQSMFEVAAADGELDESEVKVIELYTASIFGEPLGRQQIANLFDDFLAKSAIHREFDAMVSPEVAELAYGAGVLVALADGNFAEVEHARLASLGRRLGLGAEQQERVLNEGIDRYRAMVEPEHSSQSKISAPNSDGAEALLFDDPRASSAQSAHP